CMFGWDWGPKLPDMGIWRSVYVEGINTGRIENVYYTQKHEEGKVTLSCDAALDIWDNNCDNSIKARLIVTSPNGKEFETELENGGGEIVIENPKLWWVRGLGEQPLYTCRVILKKNDTILDENIKKIGLRTLSVSQDKDEWGEEFCFINNGVKIFAMGGNYIPEDQIVTRCSKERTEKLLDSCLEANYNFIRVWGGGYYPDDYFFDYCDEKGLIVWQDFMFACAAYLLSPEFEVTVRAEIKDNIIRIRNHASLGLWCGNNEIESAWEYWGWNDDPEAKADYLKLFEDIIPTLLKEYDTETFYWPSSPSSGGGFRDSSSNHAGDMHYWAIWHSFAPIDAFRKLYYRFCSEYGFESVPDIKTIRSFAKEDELDLCGNVMQAHQKCTLGNEKLMYYLAQMVNYPYDFERLIYCSQLVQADCIRSSVEHMRRARGRCMGSAYWQVNDSNPVISWSSIDYFGRWKALHYYAKRFYAPLLISCDDTDPAKPVLYVTNDTLNDENLKIVCRLRNNRAEIIREFSKECTSPALSSIKVLETDLSKDMVTLNDKRTKYLEYILYKNDELVLKGTTLFVRPKEFCFLPAKIEYTLTGNDNSFELSLSSDGYAKSVCLSLSAHDVKFSDNWFDIHGDESVKVNIPKEYGADGSLLITGEILKKELQIRNY
ncbi:MAG: glycoside hydrolase family 2 protein, partial [Lachnospiraceae bacterium]|nr:glycoside hydrolase family 2 protein [Lachnospiraceae bacterium]